MSAIHQIIALQNSAAPFAPVTLPVPIPIGPVHWSPPSSASKVSFPPSSATRQASSFVVQGSDNGMSFSVDGVSPLPSSNVSPMASYLPSLGAADSASMSPPTSVIHPPPPPPPPGAPHPGMGVLPPFLVTAGTMSLTGVAGPSEFEAHDALTKTSISFRALDTMPTMANYTYVSQHHPGQGKSSRVCEPFQQGRCRSGEQCSDFHVLPDVLARFRQQLCDWLASKEIEFMHSPPGRTFRVFCADLKEVVEVPIQALAFTRGLFLDPSIREKRSKNRHAPTTFAMIASQVPTACGLFAADSNSCKWGKWCNQAHVSSAWLQSRRGEFEQWSAALERDFQNLPSDHEFKVHDPEGRALLLVPRAAITEYTRGLYQGTQAKSPSVCMLYQKGRCTARSRCNQVHVDPQWLALQRQNMESSAQALDGSDPSAVFPGTMRATPPPSRSPTQSAGTSPSTHQLNPQWSGVPPAASKLNPKARAFVPGGSFTPSPPPASTPPPEEVVARSAVQLGVAVAPSSTPEKAPSEHTGGGFAVKQTLKTLMSFGSAEWDINPNDDLMIQFGVSGSTPTANAALLRKTPVDEDKTRLTAMLLGLRSSTPLSPAAFRQAAAAQGSLAADSPNKAAQRSTPVNQSPSFRTPVQTPNLLSQSASQVNGLEFNVQGMFPEMEEFLPTAVRMDDFAFGA